MSPSLPKRKTRPYTLNSEKSFPIDMPDDYETQQWAERKLKHMRFPPMYEENSRTHNPFNIQMKWWRSNTLLKIFPVESVFQELGKLTGLTSQKHERNWRGAKTLHRLDEDDIYKANNNIAMKMWLGEDWSPVEEKNDQTQGRGKELAEEYQTKLSKSMKKWSVPGSWASKMKISGRE